MRIPAFAIALLAAACAQAPSSIPDQTAARPESANPFSAPSAHAAAPTGGVGAADQGSPIINILPPPPRGERSPDESPTNMYHVSQAQADGFENPHNVKMTVARQFVWDQWKLAWWVQHHKKDRQYIKLHRLLFNRVNGLRADPLSRVEGDDTATQDWYERRAPRVLPASWGALMSYPEAWNKVWDNPTRLDIIPQNWFEQFLATLDQPVWQTVWDSPPPRRRAD